MIILLSKFRVTKISVSYITGENHIGSSFIRQKYFCLPTEIAVLPTETWNRISGGCHTPHPRPCDQLWNMLVRCGIMAFLSTWVTTYAECLLKANLMTLYERRTVLCKRLFSKMLEPTHKLNALVPPKNLQTYDLRSYSNLLIST
jgi:hypothetical protein